MQRKPVKKKPMKWYEIITIIFPLIFYKQCDICGMEFVRERGYKAERTRFIPQRIILIPYYVCGTCAKTRQEASELLRKKIEKRPPAPPLPP